MPTCLPRPCLAVVFALGCSSAVPRVAAPARDSGGLDAHDTGAGADAPAPDLTTWQGLRTFRIDTEWDDYDCEDTVEESGRAPGDAAVRAQLQEACPGCDHFYEVTLSTTLICGYLPLDPTPWRGLELGATTARVLRFHPAPGGGMRTEELDPAAGFDGWSVSYGYSIADGWIEAVEVDGRVDFPDHEAHP